MRMAVRLTRLVDTAAAKRAGTLLHNGLSNKVLTGVKYDQGGPVWSVAFIFDERCHPIVTPNAIESESSPAPWLDLIGAHVSEESLNEIAGRGMPQGPTPRRLNVFPFRLPIRGLRGRDVGTLPGQ